MPQRQSTRHAPVAEMAAALWHAELYIIETIIAMSGFVPEFN